MSDERGVITGHFITHWGVPSDIRPIQARGIKEFAVIEYAPGGARATWRYATNGMSSYVQFHPDPNVHVRTEVYTCTASIALWVDKLLGAIASYPKDFDTYLAEGDTIDVGSPVDQESSCYTGILIAPPGSDDPPTIGLVGGTSGDVLVHRVIGLLPEEVRFAELHGGELLQRRLMKRGEFLLDRERSPVV